MEIRYLNEALPPSAGGKACGLAQLAAMGLPVPAGFVAITPDIEELDGRTLQPFLDVLGPGEKAVRSSAVAEDGVAASFAGQFETFLSLKDGEEVVAAMRRCVENRSGRADEYARHRDTAADLTVSVVVQNMVPARCAGVLFTADPVTGRRDRVIVNAVPGMGEDLVAGRVDATVYRLPRHGGAREAEPENGDRLLTAAELEALVGGAIKAETQVGHPVDIEWAVAHSGELQFLQLRPITTLTAVHFNELDRTDGAPTDIYTRGNIGEMMPGAVTPLTASVTGRAINRGMNYFAQQSGALRRKQADHHYVALFYNHLFFNVTACHDFVKHVWQNKKENLETSIVGAIVPNAPVEPEGWLLGRVANFIRQIWNLLKAPRHARHIARLARHATVPVDDDPAKLYAALAGIRDRCAEAFSHHMIVSAFSGTFYAALLGILTKNRRPPQADDHRLAAVLLADIPDIEGADAVRALQRLAAVVQLHPPFAARFLAEDDAAALALLRGSDSPVRAQFEAFIERHGHRCVKESELSERPWRDQPTKLVRSLKTLAATKKRATPSERPRSLDETIAPFSFSDRLALRFVVPRARRAVAAREAAKANSIRVFDVARRGYRRLGAKLAEQGLLDDAEDVFFLAHEEIGVLIDDRAAHWRERAKARRAQQPLLEALRFPDVTYGTPTPVAEGECVVPIDGLRGTPVSAGTVTGPVRVVSSLAEADELQPGEIMVALMTDVGWTPYFSVIAGLITEIGSPLSHGAVVAREYGIPAVVSVKSVTSTLNTGDVVTLDAVHGVVKRA